MVQDGQDGRFSKEVGGLEKESRGKVANSRKLSLIVLGFKDEDSGKCTPSIRGKLKVALNCL